MDAVRGRWGWTARGAALPVALLAVVLGLAGGAVATVPGTDTAADWPGLWGAGRDGAAVGEGVGLGTATQAKVLWRRPLGSGYSEVAIVAGRGYTMDTDGTNDRVVAFDPTTGKELWAVPVGAAYRGHDGSDDGPISTPTVDGAQVFALGPRGGLFALEAASGKVLWKRELVADLQVAAPHYGFAAAPLLVGDAESGLVVVQAGGEAHNLVAFDRATGKTAWSVAHSKKSGYASPVFATLGGVPQVISLTADQLYGVRSEDGKLLWSHPVPDEPGRSPLVVPGDRVLVSFWGESLMVQVSAAGGAFTARELWKKPQLRATYSPTVHHAGHLFGMNGDYLVCLDAATGEVKWRQKLYGSSLIRIGGHLAVLGLSSGNLHLVEASPEGFRERFKSRVFNPGARCYTGPSWAGGKLYLRNLEEMVAVEITAG
jgi:outer membrane protein assembly factor BamB